MDQKGPVLGPFLARSIRGRDPEPLEVRSDLENGRFWSQISESSNPPFFRKFLAQTKILARGGATGHPPISECVPYVKLNKLGGWTSQSGLKFLWGLIFFWKIAESTPSSVLFQNPISNFFLWTPTWSWFNFRKKNRAVFVVFTHKPGFTGCQIGQKSPKRDQNGRFWSFCEKSTTYLQPKHQNRF